MRKGFGAAAGALLICLYGASSIAQSIGPFEKPSVFETADLLPESEITGPNWQLEELTTTNGLDLLFTFNTPFGVESVDGRLMFNIRAHELRAVDHMEQVKGTDVYAEAAKNAAAGPFATAADLITSPVETTGNIVSGTGKWIGSVWDGATNWGADDDNVLEAATGFAAAKRAYAYAYQIDPYSRFEPLQSQLKDITWAGFAGGLTVQVAFQVVPDTPGLILQVGSFLDSAAQRARDNTPAELRRLNKKQLDAVGVDPTVSDIFLSGEVYSPTEKDLLVAALEQMAGIDDLTAIVRQAALDSEPSQPVYRRRQVELMAGYTKSFQGVRRVVIIQNAMFMQRSDGVVVGVFPVDYVNWTKDVGVSIHNVHTDIQQMPDVSGVEIWLTGHLSDLTKERIAAYGWTVNEGIGDMFDLQ